VEVPSRYHDVVWPVVILDPPSPAWERLYELAKTYASAKGIDLYVGVRLPRMLRDQGFVDVQATSLTHVCLPGHPRRTIAPDVLSAFTAQFASEGLVGFEELDELVEELRAQIADPDTFAVSPLYIQGWGIKS
jgi:hypothetical protein